MIPLTDQHGELNPLHALLQSLVEKHHAHLAEAKIALLWRLNWKADADGHLILGQARKASDVDKELHNYDFAILLNYEVWASADFNKDQKRALVDHELCHCVRATTKDGDPKFDERGRPLWRLRGHDLEEFDQIVIRHGCWKRHIEAFANAALKRGPLYKNDAVEAALGQSKNGDAIETLKLANDPVFLKAAADLCPSGDSSIDSVELSTTGADGKRKSVRLTRETGRRIRSRAAQIVSARRENRRTN